MPVSVGDRLGPYEIVEAIGAGGMGEVFRARDTRLNRSVAIKFLSARFSVRRYGQTLRLGWPERQLFQLAASSKRPRLPLR